MVPGSLRWSFLQQLGRVAPSYLGLLVTSRILAPSDFGVVGVAAVWLALLNAFVGSGFGPRVVQDRTTSRSELASLATTTSLLGVAAAAVGFALAAPLCALVGVPAATPYAQVSALSFALAGIGVIPSAVAQRDMRFRTLAVRDSAASVLSAVVTVAAAVAGAGAWALVLQPLVQASSSSALIWWAERHRVALGRPSWTVVRRHIRYSGEVTAFQLVKAVLQTVYRLVVAAALGTYELGLYMLGYRLAVETTAVVRAGLGGFLFPFFASRQDDVTALTASFVRSTRSLLALMSCLLSVLAVTAPFLVPLVLGSQWRQAVTVTQILALVALADCVFGTSGELMKATGDTRGLLRWSVLYAVAMLALLPVGAVKGGLDGAAAGAAVAALVLVPYSFAQAAHQLDARPMELARHVLGPVTVSGGTALVALGAMALRPAEELPVIVAAVVALLALAYRELRRASRVSAVTITASTV